MSELFLLSAGIDKLFFFFSCKGPGGSVEVLDSVSKWKDKLGGVPVPPSTFKGLILI